MPALPADAALAAQYTRRRARTAAGAHRLSSPPRRAATPGQGLPGVGRRRTRAAIDEARGRVRGARRRGQPVARVRAELADPAGGGPRRTERRRGRLLREERRDDSDRDVEWRDTERGEGSQADGEGRGRRHPHPVHQGTDLSRLMADVGPVATCARRAAPGGGVFNDDIQPERRQSPSAPARLDLGQFGGQFSDGTLTRVRTTRRSWLRRWSLGGSPAASGVLRHGPVEHADGLPRPDAASVDRWPTPAATCWPGATTAEGRRSTASSDPRSLATPGPADHDGAAVCKPRPRRQPAALGRLDPSSPPGTGPVDAAAELLPTGTGRREHDSDQAAEILRSPTSAPTTRHARERRLRPRRPHGGTRRLAAYAGLATRPRQIADEPAPLDPEDIRAPGARPAARPGGRLLGIEPTRENL